MRRREMLVSTATGICIGLAGCIGAVEQSSVESHQSVATSYVAALDRGDLEQAQSYRHRTESEQIHSEDIRPYEEANLTILSHRVRNVSNGVATVHIQVRMEIDGEEYIGTIKVSLLQEGNHWYVTEARFLPNDTAEELLRHIDSTIGELQADINTKKEEIELLEQELHEIESDISAIEAEIDVLINERQTLQDSIAGPRSEIASLEQDRDTLEEEVDEIVDEISTLETELEEGDHWVFEEMYIQREINELDRERRLLESEIRIVSSEIELIESEIVGVESDIESIRSDIREKEDELSTLLRKRRETIRAIDDISEEISTLEAEKKAIISGEA